MRISAASQPPRARLTLRVLRGQVAQANHRLTVSGERLSHSLKSLMRQQRDRYAGLAIRLKASRLSNAQAQRQIIARDRERTLRLAERARRALLTAMQRLEARVAHSGQLLGALSYRGVLARGFALVRDQQRPCRPRSRERRTRRTAQHRICRRARRSHRGRGSAGDRTRAGRPAEDGRARSKAGHRSALQNRSIRAACFRA